MATNNIEEDSNPTSPFNTPQDSSGSTALPRPLSFSSTARSFPRPPSISVPFRPSNLNPNVRRQPSDTTDARVRNVTFLANPVAMSHSPPIQAQASNSSSNTTPDRGRSEERPASVPLIVRADDSASPSHASRGRGGHSNVKHLTCFWWKERGTCRFSAEDCLYAHHDTGRYTDAPRQIVAGEPARAGRNLERALSQVNIGSESHAFQLGGRTPGSSRSGTPVGAFGARPTTPSLLSRAHSPTPSYVPNEVLALQNELGFYKSLALTNQNEKNLLINMIHGLQGEVHTLKDDVAQLESDKGALARENDALKASSTIYAPRPSPYGPIGSGLISIGGATNNTTTASTSPGLGHDLAPGFRSPAPTIGWRSASASTGPTPVVRRSVSPTTTNTSDDENEGVGAGQGHGQG